MTESKPLVTITGITGYLGSQVGWTFLDSDKFRIRGTVRSKDNAEKIDPLKTAYGDKFDTLELVEADLLKPDSMIAACTGSDYIVHVASPFPLAPPEHEDDLIKPAVEGTTAAIKAAIATNAKKIVLTSSCVSIGMGYPTDRTTFTEADWSKTENFKVPDFNAYAKSKTYAEKKAWELVEAHNAKLTDGKTRLELVSINPGLILGPNLIKTNFSSGDMIAGVITGGMPELPASHFPLVDVRDVAKAHLEGVLRDEANGKRFILNAVDDWFAVTAAIVKESGEFPGYNTHEKMGEKDATGLKPFSFPMTFVNTASKEILGIEYTPLKDSVIDMGKTLIATGYIPAAE